jgi:hypothetical protein
MKGNLTLSMKEVGVLTLYLCAPLQPQLEDVVVSAALNNFIACIILNIVKFVLHEQIFGAHLVAADQ